MEQTHYDRGKKKTASIMEAPEANLGTLGTFGGVFTPSILTILGIILFLRLGYVTGSAGMGRALIIIAISNLVSIITSQSLSAIATNMRIKGGGDYYLISRTLGRQFGGAIGLVLYLAQSVSVAFYCIGFAEAVTAMTPQMPYITPRIIAFIAVGLLFLLAWLGADWATRFQYGVMALLVAALFSFFIGGIFQWDPALLVSNWKVPTGAPPFWIVFGIFFPAVTGFTQGVSMSGDLRDPGKSLPLGTFLAVGISIVVYFSVAVILSGVLPNALMMSDYQAIKKVAKYGYLIDAGVIAATLSSAMASFMGGPRILQALSADRIFPFLIPFAKVAKNNGNPHRAILLTLAIAIATIGLGQLNLIARLVSMFFLISYGLLNYATYYEARTQSPSFRPRFKWFNKYLSLLGCFICLGIILALDIKNGLIAIAIMTAIHQYLRHSTSPARWADSSGAHAFQVIRKRLSDLARSPVHHRNWRPHILAFTHHDERCTPLLTFANWIEGRSGLITAVRMLQGTGLQMRKIHQEAEEKLQRHILDNQLKAFALVVVADDFTSALPTLLQSYGIAQLNANTVLVNWYGQSGKGIGGLQALKYGHNLKIAFRQGFNLVLFHYNKSRWESMAASKPEGRRIDVWWRGDATSRLMLLFAYLTTRHNDWNKCEIRVMTAGSGKRLAKVKEEMNRVLEEVRIDACAFIVPNMSLDTVLLTSSKSSLVFLPFKIKQYRLTDLEGLSLERVLSKLPPTALIMAAEDIDLDAEPEEGSAGELAEAMDNLLESERKTIAAQKTHARAESVFGNLKTTLAAALEEEIQNDEVIERLKEDLIKAEQHLSSAFRKAAKSQAKSTDAAQLAQQLGGPATDETE